MTENSAVQKVRGRPRKFPYPASLTCTLSGKVVKTNPTQFAEMMQRSGKTQEELIASYVCREARKGVKDAIKAKDKAAKAEARAAKKMEKEAAKAEKAAEKAAKKVVEPVAPVETAVPVEVPVATV